MKAKLANFIKLSIRIVFLFFIPILIIFSSSGCIKESKSNLVKCNLDNYSLYPKVVEQILPSFTIEESDNKAYYYLDDGSSVEAFDTQAVGAIETGIAKYWYPQYLATVIIAIDRDQTDAIVTSWNDLFSTQQEVGLFDMPGNIQMITAAMSYGLEGEDYSKKKTIELLNLLNDNGQLKMNSFASPIIICYDYQVAGLIENGRNIEIVIPKEGTFTYEKGLLSNEILKFEGNVDNLLLESKLRLLNGENSFFIYPDKVDYAPAVRVNDYKYFAKTTQDVNSLIERDVLNSKKYMSINNREHILIALIFIIIVNIWTVSVMKRSMQKGINYSAFFTGVILNGWTLVRLIKYQVELNTILIRYLWYSFYIFQLTLPLVLLWMAWAIDKPQNKILPPKWWRIMVILISLLIILVFTNDLHGFVFQIDLSRPDWYANYSYGFGYYVILLFSMISLIAIFIILIQKSIKNPRKNAIIFPTIILLLFGFYTYRYIMRDPLIYQTDLTIVTGLFTMIMFEACIRSGLIPVNTMYIDLFKRSPLKIQIINKKLDVVFASASAVAISKSNIEEVLASSTMPVLQADKSLLYVNIIPGGYSVWNEDISKLYQLHNEIQESTEMLKEANQILAKEEKINRFINEQNEKKHLMEQLESEISGSLEQLSTMIELLPNSENQSLGTTRIALLLCYIKRRCNLFFQEKETSTVLAEELISYMDELSEITLYSNVKIASVNEIKGNLAVRHATLFFDFFYEVVDVAVAKGCTYIIEHFGIEDELIILRLLLSKNDGILKLNSRLIEATGACKGNIQTKDLEDTIGISISFPKGGNDI